MLCFVEFGTLIFRIENLLRRYVNISSKKYYNYFNRRGYFRANSAQLSNHLRKIVDLQLHFIQNKKTIFYNNTASLNGLRDKRNNIKKKNNKNLHASFSTVLYTHKRFRFLIRKRLLTDPLSNKKRHAHTIRLLCVCCVWYGVFM